MKLETNFNRFSFQKYTDFLKASGTSQSTIDRKLSSLNSFQSFLVKKGYLKPNQSKISSPDQRKPNIFNKIFHSNNTSPSPISKYLIFGSLIAIFLGLVYGLYTQTILKAKKELAYSTTTSLVRPGRVLSFQGRLTDSSGNPITSPTDIVFKFYNNSIGGTELYASSIGNSQTITPDENGIFSVVIGKSHGTEIPSTVFTENAEVWLEITADSEIMDPRQQIATVAYALNSETLQGLPPSASGLKDTVLVIDGSGNINLGETSPSIISNSGTMAIEGQALLLKASDSSGGNITINPDGNGVIRFITEGTSPSTGGFIDLSNANIAGGNLINAQINNDNRGYNFISFQNYNVGTTTLSTRFSINANGSAYFGAGITTPAFTLSSGTSSGYILQSDANGNASWVNPTSSGIGITYNTGSGLTNSSNIFKLGGPITENTRLNIGNTESLYIQYSTGNIGIGTTNPISKLHVSGNISLPNSGAIIFDDGVGPKIQENGNGFLIYAGSSGTQLGLSMDGNARTRIGSAWFDAGLTGNVGIGNTNPQYKLDVTGDINLTGTIYASGYSGISGQVLASTGTGLQWVNASSVGGTYAFSNGLTSYVNYVGLGGSLAQNTSIGTSNYSLSFVGLGGTQSLYIGTSGYVGIGTTNPHSKFEITGNSDAELILNRNGGWASGPAGIKFATNAGVTDFWTFGMKANSTNNIYLSKNTSDYLTVTEASGNVGIGTTNPSQKLDINGSINIGGSMSIGSSQLVTNLNSDLIDGLHSSSFLQVGGTGFFNTALNGLQAIGNTGVGLGGTLTQNTQIGLSSFNLTLGTNTTSPNLYLSSTGNVGIGTTNPTYKLHVVGNGYFSTSLGIGTSLSIGTNLTIGSSFISVGSSNIVTNLNSDLLDGYHAISFLRVGSTGFFNTALNGLQAIGSTGIGLGGTLIQNTTIGTSSFSLSLSTGNTISNTGTQSQYPFQITQGGGILAFGADNNFAYIQTFASKPLQINNAGNNVYFGGSGNVGIGLTNTSYKLHVAGSIGTTSITTSGNITIGGTFVSVGSTNLTTNLNADLLDGYHATSFLQTGYTGFFNTALNGLQKIGSTAVGLGGTLTQNTQIGTSSFNLSFIGLGGSQSLYLSSNGNAGFGTTAPGAKLELVGIGSLLRIGDTAGNTLVNITDSSAQFNLPTTFTSTGDVSLANNLNFTNSSASYINSAAPLYLQAGESFNSSDLTLRTYNTGQVIIDSSALNVGGTFILSQGASNGYILTSDASGNSFWAPNTGIGTTYAAGIGLTLSSTNIFSLDLASTNTWTGVQTFSNNFNVGSSALISNLNANYLNGFSSSSFLQVGGTGFFNTATNGLSTIGTTGIGLGGTLTQNTRIETSSFGLSFIGLGNSQSLFIGTSGYVGIGTSNPTAILDIDDNATIGTGLRVTGGGSGYNLATFIRDIGGSGRITIHSSANNPQISFQSSSTTFSAGVNGNNFKIANNTAIGTSDYFTITNSGSVGIGTTSPTQKLDIVGAALVSVGITTPQIQLTNVTVGTETTALFIDASGSLTKRALGTMAFDSGTYDNYGSWNLLTNGSGTTAINSGASVNFVNGIGISLVQSGSTVTINNNGVGTTYGATNGISLISGNFGLGGTLTQNTRLNIGNTEVLYIDYATGNVGIGTTNPGTKLDVNGNVKAAWGLYANNYYPSSGNNLNFFSYNGSSYNNSIFVQGSTSNVGIGTTNPQSLLEISKDTSGLSFDQFKITNPNAIVGEAAGITFSTRSAGSGKGYFGYMRTSADGFGRGDFIFLNNSSADDLSVSSSDEVMRITNSGLVGIGTTNPSQKLDINGSINIGGSMSIGSSQLVTNLNSDLIDGLHSSSFLQVGGTGFFNTALNGLQAIGNTGVGLGGSLTQNTRLNIGNTEVFYVDYATGHVGIGTTDTSTYRLHINGSTYFTSFIIAQDAYLNKFYDNNNNNYFVDPATTGISAVLAGKVGIGTTNPKYNLEVSGNDATIGIGLSGREKTLKVGTLVSPYDPLTITSRGAGSGWRGAIDFNVSYSGGTEVNGMRLIANTDGSTANLGLGTTAPIYQLDMTGSLRVGGTFVSVGSTNLTTNLNADLLDGYHYNNLPYDNYGAWVLANGSTYTTVSSGTTIAIAAGTGIGITLSGNTLTINNTYVGTTYAAGVGLTLSNLNVFSLNLGNTNVWLAPQFFGNGIGVTGNSTFQNNLTVGGTISTNNLFTSGYVGIGTTNPNFPLTIINNGVQESSAVLSNGANVASIQGANSAYFMGRDTTNDIEFLMGTSTLGQAFAGSVTSHGFGLRTNNTNRLYIAANGSDTLISTRLGIGATSSNYNFNVVGNGYFSTSLSVGTSLSVTGNLTIGGTFISVGSTNLTTNLNADLLDGLHSTSFLQVGYTGFFNTALNGLTAIGSTGIGLGGTLTQVSFTNINIGTGSSGLSILGINNNTQALTIRTNGSIGLGTTAPSYQLDMTGSLRVGGTFVSVGSTNLVTNLNANYLNGHPDTYFLDFGDTGAFIQSLSNGVGISISGTGIGRTITNIGVTSIIGTANQIIASGSTGAVTLSLPQGIGTTSNVQFNNLTIGGTFISVGSTNLTTNLNADLIDGYHYNTLPYDNYQYWVAKVGNTVSNVSSGNTITFTAGTGIGLTFAANTITINNTSLGTTYAAGVGLSLRADNTFDIKLGAVGLGLTTNSSNQLINSGVLSLTGTANQIIVTGAGGTGALTLSLPQGIGTTSNVQFNNLTIGGTFISVGSTNLTTNLNADLLDGLHSTSFLQVGYTGFFNTALNGLTAIGSTGIGLGGTLTQVSFTNINIGTGSSGLSILGINNNTQALTIRTNGSIGLGTTAPSYQLDMTGSLRVGGTFVSVGSTNLVTNLNANYLNGHPDTYFLDFGDTGAFIQSLSNGVGISISGTGIGRTITNIGVTSIIGTANQIIASGSTGAVTLSLPQGIGTTSNVQFNNLTIGGTFISVGSTNLTTNLNADLIDGLHSTSLLQVGYTGFFNTALNGLQKIGSTAVGLGGTLTQATQIGTSNYSLSFVGLGGTQSLFIGASGFVGIGTTNPVKKLDIVGDINLSGTIFVGSGGTGVGTTGSSGQILASNGAGGLQWIAAGGVGTTYAAGVGLTLSNLNVFSLNLGNTNVWLAPQFFGNGIGVTGNLTIGGTFVSVGSTNLVTNLNANYLNGHPDTYFLDFGDTGAFIQSLSNGVGISISGTGIGRTVAIDYDTANLALTGNKLTTIQPINVSAQPTFARLGLGSTSALYLLNVGGTANFNNLFTSGSVGIGTTAPFKKLDVVGDINLSGTLFVSSGGTGIGVTGSINQVLASNGSGSLKWLDAITSATNGLSLLSGSVGLGGELTQDTAIGTSSFSLSFLGLGSTQSLFISSSGYVGIGTSAPSAALEVVGDIKADNIYGRSNTTNEIDLYDSGITLKSYLSAQYMLDNDNNDTSETYVVKTNGGQSTLLWVGQDGGSGNAALPQVGIGTTDPNHTLEVAGDAYFNNLSVASTLLSDNLNADLLDGHHASEFIMGLTPGVGITIVGTGDTRTISFDGTQIGNMTFGSGSTFTWTFNAGATTTFLNFNNGYIGIGTTSAPRTALEVNGTIAAQKFVDLTSYDQFFLDLANSDYNSSSLALDRRGSIKWNAKYSSGWYTIDSGVASKIENRLNGILLSTSVGTTTANSSISSWRQNLFLSDNGYIGIGTTTPQSAIELAASTSTFSSVSGDITLDAASGNISLNGGKLINLFGIEASSGDKTKPSYSFSSDTDSGLFSGGNNIVSIGTGGTTRLTIGSSGYVGIGTDSPTGQFQVNIGNTQAFYINSSGYVGIGTTAPSEALEINGNLYLNPSTIYGSISSYGTTRGSIQISYPFTTSTIDGQNRPVTYGNNLYLDSAGAWQKAQTSIGGAALIMGAPNSSTGGFTFMGLTDTDNATVTTTALMSITGGGLVGIGTTSPSTKLHIYDSSDAGLTIGGDSDGDIARLNLFEVTTSGNEAGFGIKYHGSRNVLSFNTWTAGVEDDANPVLAFERGGNVGIGLSNAAYKLDIQASAPTTYVMKIKNIGNTSVTSSDKGLLIALGLGNSRPATNYYVAFANANGTVNGKIQGRGTGGTGVAYTTGSADYAEYFKKTDLSESLPPGSLVQIVGNNTVTKTTSGKPLGVVSDSAGFIGNSPSCPVGEEELCEIEIEKYNALVGMMGQIRTLVSTENGPISPGDPLTISSTPGVAMKATTAGYTIGHALESYNQPGIARINSYINPSWYDPDIFITENGQVAVNYNVSAEVLDSLGYSGTKNELETASYSLTDSTGKVIDRIGQYGHLFASKITAGLISAKSIIVDNLAAKKIASETIITGDITATTAEINNLTAQSIGASEASFSTVYADQIINPEGNISDVFAAKVSALRDEVKAMIASATATTSENATESALLAEASTWDISVATSSADLTLDNLTLNDSLIISSQLVVQGHSSLTTANISSTLTVGQIALQDNIIETTSENLYIQPSGLATIHLGNDRLIIGTDGNIAINGNLNVSGSLVASMLKADSIETESLTANKINIATLSASPIIAVDATASTATSSAQLASNATIGTITLAAGQTEITINNTLLTSSSMIYLTPTSSTQNQVPYIKSKDDNSFTIAIDQALNDNININWWLIN